MAKNTEMDRADNAGVTLGTVAESVGEGLGQFLNQVESQWHAVRGQRETLVKNLRAVRDKANALLAEAGDIEFPLPAALRRRAKNNKPRKTDGSAIPPSVKRSGQSQKPRPVISIEGRARIAEAQRARWARVRAAKRSGKG